MRLRFEPKQKRAGHCYSIWNNGFIFMETNSHRTDRDGNVQPENNYAAHQEDPAPSPEAIKEPNDRPASSTIWLAVILAVIILAIIYLIYIF